jgi:DMSO/TMAO reductase YedYZ molybdopterin-dependent catalytic subunit
MQKQSAGMIMREREPLNVEFPFSTLEDFFTANESFYVRNHFETPEVEEKTWKLKIEGAIEKPFEIGYEELVQMPSKTLAATIECAGNSRVFLAPKENGVQWELGAVGTAEWTGVPLKALLEKAGVKNEAMEVVVVGADKGEIKDPPKSPGEINFARSLPLEKALTENILLAYEMNGERLAPEHGFPVRLIVPGWYGVAWVKWVERIVVADEPFSGYFQTADYSYWETSDGLPVQMKPVTQMQVKSEIARPAPHEVVPVNKAYKIKGAAWSGDARIAKVEISTDGGANWNEAELTGGAQENVWQMWQYDWKTPSKPGKYTLLARATDERGRVQPIEHAKGRGGYLVNHALPVEIEVK